MVTVWAVAILVFIVVEAATVGLASIWFAIGAGAALVSAIFGAPTWLQILWFVMVSALTLWLTRPLVAKYINNHSQPTNADRVIGKSCVVTERIDNIAGTGAVTVEGKRWTARSLSGEVYEPEELVTALRIEGVKLIVNNQ